MHARHIAVALGLLGLVLGGCDDKPKASGQQEGHAVLTAGNTRIEVKGEGSSVRVELPKELPAYAAVYPGADVRSFVATGAGGPVSAIITYRTNASPAEVMAFHKQRAAAAGMTTSQETDLGSIRTFGAQKGQAQVNVTLVAEQGAYSVQVAYR